MTAPERKTRCKNPYAATVAVLGEVSMPFSLGRIASAINLRLAILAIFLLANEIMFRYPRLDRVARLPSAGIDGIETVARIMDVAVNETPDGGISHSVALGWTDQQGRPKGPAAVANIWAVWSVIAMGGNLTVRHDADPIPGGSA